MKTKKLKTTVNNKSIFKIQGLSYHTKCILSKLVTDFLCGDEILDFIYLEENIFSIWPSDIVTKALDELSELDVMGMCNCEECDEDSNECGNMQIVFNPEFLDKACPYIGCCPCCSPTPKNFNVIYN
jgi:hypothetical protein